MRVGRSVIDMQRAFGAIGDKNPVDVGTVQYRMPDADSLDAVNEFARPNIVNFNRLVIFGDDEYSAAFQIGRQMVEMILNAWHSRRSQVLCQLVRRNFRFSSANI